MKRHSLVQFVFNTACFSRKQNLQYSNSFIFNFKHQTNKGWYFFEQGWGKFWFGKNFLGTWEFDFNIGQEISVQLEKNEGSKKIDPYCCAIKTMVSGKLETVGHTPRDVSRHTYFYIKEEWGRIDGPVLSTRYIPSSIPSGGLEIRLMMTFRSPRHVTHQKIKDFMTKRYFYDHKPVTDNVELD